MSPKSVRREVGGGGSVDVPEDTKFRAGGMFWCYNMSCSEARVPDSAGTLEVIPEDDDSQSTSGLGLIASYV